MAMYENDKPLQSKPKMLNSSLICTFQTSNNLFQKELDRNFVNIKSIDLITLLRSSKNNSQQSEDEQSNNYHQCINGRYDENYFSKFENENVSIVKNLEKYDNNEDIKIPIFEGLTDYNVDEKILSTDDIELQINFEVPLINNINKSTEGISEIDIEEIIIKSSNINTNNCKNNNLFGDNLTDIYNISIKNTIQNNDLHIIDYSEIPEIEDCYLKSDLNICQRLFYDEENDKIDTMYENVWRKNLFDEKLEDYGNVKRTLSNPVIEYNILQTHSKIPVTDDKILSFKFDEEIIEAQNIDASKLLTLELEPYSKISKQSMEMKRDSDKNKDFDDSEIKIFSSNTNDLNKHKRKVELNFLEQTEIDERNNVVELVNEIRTEIPKMYNNDNFDKQILFDEPHTIVKRINEIRNDLIFEENISNLTINKIGTFSENNYEINSHIIDENLDIFNNNSEERNDKLECVISEQKLFDNTKDNVEIINRISLLSTENLKLLSDNKNESENQSDLKIRSIYDNAVEKDNKNSKEILYDEMHIKPLKMTEIFKSYDIVESDVNNKIPLIFDENVKDREDLRSFKDKNEIQDKLNENNYKPHLKDKISYVPERQKEILSDKESNLNYKILKISDNNEEYNEHLSLKFSEQILFDESNDIEKVIEKHEPPFKDKISKQIAEDVEILFYSINDLNIKNENEKNFKIENMYDKIREKKILNDTSSKKIVLPKSCYVNEEKYEKEEMQVITDLNNDLISNTLKTFSSIKKELNNDILKSEFDYKIPTIFQKSAEEKDDSEEESFKKRNMTEEKNYENQYEPPSIEVISSLTVDKVNTFSNNNDDLDDNVIELPFNSQYSEINKNSNINDKGSEICFSINSPLQISFDASIDSEENIENNNYATLYNEKINDEEMFSAKNLNDNEIRILLNSNLMEIYNDSNSSEQMSFDDSDNIEEKNNEMNNDSFYMKNIINLTINQIGILPTNDYNLNNVIESQLSSENVEKRNDKLIFNSSEEILFDDTNDIKEIIYENSDEPIYEGKNSNKTNGNLKILSNDNYDESENQSNFKIENIYDNIVDNYNELSDINSKEISFDKLNNFKENMDEKERTNVYKNENETNRPSNIEIARNSKISIIFNKSVEESSDLYRSSSKERSFEEINDIEEGMDDKKYESLSNDINSLMVDKIEVFSENNDSNDYKVKTHFFPHVPEIQKNIINDKESKEFFNINYLEQLSLDDSTDIEEFVVAKKLETYHKENTDKLTRNKIEIFSDRNENLNEDELESNLNFKIINNIDDVNDKDVKLKFSEQIPFSQFKNIEENIDEIKHYPLYTKNENYLTTNQIEIFPENNNDLNKTVEEKIRQVKCNSSEQILFDESNNIEEKIYGNTHEPLFKDKNNIQITENVKILSYNNNNLNNIRSKNSSNFKIGNKYDNVRKGDNILSGISSKEINFNYSANLKLDKIIKRETDQKLQFPHLYSGTDDCLMKNKNIPICEDNDNLKDDKPTLKSYKSSLFYFNNNHIGSSVSEDERKIRTGYCLRDYKINPYYNSLEITRNSQNNFESDGSHLDSKRTERSKIFSLSNDFDNERYAHPRHVSSNIKYEHKSFINSKDDVPYNFERNQINNHFENYLPFKSLKYNNERNPEKSQVNEMKLNSNTNKDTIKSDYLNRPVVPEQSHRCYLNEFTKFSSIKSSKENNHRVKDFDLKISTTISPYSQVKYLKPTPYIDLTSDEYIDKIISKYTLEPLKRQHSFDKQIDSLPFCQDCHKHHSVMKYKESFKELDTSNVSLVSDSKSIMVGNYGINQFTSNNKRTQSIRNDRLSDSSKFLLRTINQSKYHPISLINKDPSIKRENIMKQIFKSEDSYSLTKESNNLNENNLDSDLISLNMQVYCRGKLIHDPFLKD